jgi:hypothetical protein
MSLDFLEQNGMKKAFHPPYSADLAPSNFYLCGHVKLFLAGHKFPNWRPLFDAVQDTLNGIEKLVWIEFFLLEWRDSSDVLQSIQLPTIQFPASVIM